MAPDGASSRWAAYHDAQAGRGVRPLCREAMRLAGPGRGRTAVDLGCGAGREVRALLDAGWRVHAVDGAPGTRERVLAAVGGAGRERLVVEEVSFAGLAALPDADLVHAGYSLPFAAPEDFARLWALIRSALRPGGLLAVDLFGARDSWAGTGCTTVTGDTAKALLHGLESVVFREAEWDGRAYSGPKHWHVLHLLARRPA